MTISAELEAIIRTILYILGCGMAGGFLRYIRHSADKEFNQVNLLAGLMSSCLCSIGGFAIGELRSLPFSMTAFLMILLAFSMDGCFEAIDHSIATLIEDGGRAIIRILEHRGTKE